MRVRSVRPNIYLPVVRFGVVVADWKYILWCDPRWLSGSVLLSPKDWQRPHVVRDWRSCCRLLLWILPLHESGSKGLLVSTFDPSSTRRLSRPTHGPRRSKAIRKKVANRSDLNSKSGIAMDSTTVIGGLTAATVSGVGASAVTRLVPLAWRSHQDLQVVLQEPAGVGRILAKTTTEGRTSPQARDINHWPVSGSTSSFRWLVHSWI